MHLYPASLLITAAVLLPNVVYGVFPPLNLQKYGPHKDSRLLVSIERFGQTSSFVLPIFFKLSFTGILALLAWAIMGLSLGIYYAGWIRFFARERDYALLFRPMIGIPVPMAVSPVVFLLVSSCVLGSVLQAIATLILAVGHIAVTAREHRRVSGIDNRSA